MSICLTGPQPSSKSSKPEMNNSRTNAFDAFRAKRRFHGLDGIRCVSIVAVMYFHYTFADPRLGKLGVDLFFIISGFLITTLLLRERDKTGRIGLRNFWMRRILRIFPIYYGFIFIQLVIFQLIPMKPEMVKDFYYNLPAFLTFTNNWFVHLQIDRSVIFYHAWSLAAEEQFYLLWPPILIYLTSVPKMLIIIAILIIIDVTLTNLVRVEIINLGENGNSIITSLQTAICIGVIAAIVLHHQRTFDLVIRFLNWYWTTSLAVGTAVTLIIFDAPDVVVYLVLAVFLMSSAVTTSHALAPLINSFPLGFVGRVSYGMYIMHMAAINAVRLVVFPERAPTDELVVTVGFLFTIAAAAGSFYLYERPILALRSRFRPKYRD